MPTQAPRRRSRRAGALAVAAAAALAAAACTPAEPSSILLPEPTVVSASPSAPAPTAEAAATPTPPANPGGFHVPADSQAARAWQRALDEGRAADAALLERIATTPTAVWFGSWNGIGEVSSEVDGVVSAAAAADETPVIVVYGIPARDCGSFSGGGFAPEQYLEWVEQVAAGIAGRETWVVLEPDALSQLGDCDGQGDRLGYLSSAAEILAGAGARVYLDAGNPNWHSASETARRLQLAGTDHLTGFALNVSNFASPESNRAFGDEVAALTGLQYVIDTSRSGNGWSGEWCNPSGRALGVAPERFSAGALDAYLWIKAPGESDGTCNGGPAAGVWWEEYALDLARNA